MKISARNVLKGKVKSVAHMKLIKFILLTAAFTGFLFKGPSPLFCGQENIAPEEFKLQQQKRSSEYLAGQGAETKTFMESLKEMGRDEKLLAVKDFKTKHYAENCEFREKMHAAQVDFVKARMELNPSLPQAMKDKKLALLEREYEEFKIFHAQKNKENMEFIDGLIADKSKDGQELDKLLQDFMKSQKSDAKQFLEKQNEKYRKSMQ